LRHSLIISSSSPSTTTHLRHSPLATTVVTNRLPQPHLGAAPSLQTRRPLLPSVPRPSTAAARHPILARRLLPQRHQTEAGGGALGHRLSLQSSFNLPQHNSRSQRPLRYLFTLLRICLGFRGPLLSESVRSRKLFLKTTSRIRCGAVVRSRDLRRQTDIARTEGVRNNDRRRLHLHHRQRIIQSGLIRLIPLYMGRTLLKLYRSLDRSTKELITYIPGDFVKLSHENQSESLR
jgi:hypothetical protein